MEAYHCYASDLHFEAYEERCRVRFRIDGRLLERYAIGKENYAALVNQIKILANLDISEKRLPQDGRIFSIGRPVVLMSGCLVCRPYTVKRSFFAY